jgi:hypothetical protein
MMVATYLLRLVIAHLIGDFILQPKKWVKSKRKKKIKSKYLYLHAVVHGLLAYVLIAEWKQLWVPLLVIIIHWGIDLLKSYQKNNFKWFLSDQAFHLVSLILLWIFFYNQPELVVENICTISQQNTIWWLAAAYLFITTPTAIIINRATMKWQKELKEKKGNESLKNAGKWIGILERILTLTFILIGEFAAIGFLIAAKSIFRFGDLTNGKERKLTEYILIGTLLSFSITIIIGILVKNQLQ